MSLITKLRMIHKLLNTNDAILITYDGNDFNYWHDGESLMFAQLFMRLCKFIPNWKRQWHNDNAIDK